MATWGFNSELNLNDWILGKLHHILTKLRHTYTIQKPYFDKSSATVCIIINRIWLSQYPHCQYIIYNNGSEFKLYFDTLCVSYDLKHKPISVKNTQMNAILEQMHRTIMVMFCAADIDMINTVHESDIANFLPNTIWAICSTYHTVLKTLPSEFLDRACCLMSHSLLHGKK